MMYYELEIKSNCLKIQFNTRAITGVCVESQILRLISFFHLPNPLGPLRGYDVAGADPTTAWTNGSSALDQSIATKREFTSLANNKGFPITQNHCLCHDRGSELTTLFVSVY